jgi:hypothetical protein
MLVKDILYSLLSLILGFLLVPGVASIWGQGEIAPISRTGKLSNTGLTLHSRAG